MEAGVKLGKPLEEPGIGCGCGTQAGPLRSFSNLILKSLIGAHMGCVETGRQTCCKMRVQFLIIEFFGGMSPSPAAPSEHSSPILQRKEAMVRLNELATMTQTWHERHLE